MFALTPPPHLLQGSVSDVRIVLEVVAAAFAVRAYRHHRTRSLRLLRDGFLCLAVTEVCLLLFTGLMGFAFPQLARLTWIYWANPIAVITFLVLSILSFYSVLCEQKASGTTDV
jgi:hypothetical protein